MSLLLFLLGVFFIQSASASPANRNLGGNFTPLYQCPPTTGKCDSIVLRTPCNDDRYCQQKEGDPGGEPSSIGCCNVPCKTTKYCVKMNKYNPSSGKKNIVFLVDGTVNENRDYIQVEKEFQEVKKFLKNVVRGLVSSQSRVAIIQFGGKNDIKTEVDALELNNNNIAAIIRDLDYMKQVRGSDRRTGEALAAASNKLYEMEALYDIDHSKSSTQGVVVVITRGKARDLKHTRKEISMMSYKGVRVISLAVGPHAENLISHLKELSCSSSDVFTARYKELPQKVDDILRGILLKVEESCIRESLSCDFKKYDIYIAIDGSASINYKVFERKRKLLMDLLVFLKGARSSNINVGIMQFSEKEKTNELVPLGKQSLSDIQAAVERMKFHSGRKTMLGDALMRVRKVFDGSGGDRSDAENKLIVFNDGRAHDLSVAMLEAEELKKKGVEVITVSVRASGTKTETMASDPKLSLKIKLTSFADSTEYANKIESLICPV